MNKISWVLTVLLPAVGLALLSVGDAAAQYLRPERTFFVRPNTGIVSYMGDNSRSLVSFSDPFPYSVGLDLGYQFSPRFGMQAGYLANKDVRVTDLTRADLRHTFDLTGRFALSGASGLAPYVQIGAFTSRGEVPSGSGTERRSAYGPVAGIGLDLPLSNRVSLFLETNLRAAFPDDALDGYDEGGFGNFDLHSSFGTGLKINFRSGLIPVRIQSITGPTEVRVGDEARYAAVVNDNRATKPVRYEWDFNDGGRATGMAAVHRFTRPGMYTVRFTASNRGSIVTEELDVEVQPALVAPSVIRITANPASPDTFTPVTFGADVRGDTPLSYEWTFGDGGSSTDASPEHQFDEVGTYVVTLRLRNEVGTDERTLSVRVRPYEAEICSEVVDMNTAFFDLNSSQLTAAARRVLTENANILSQCPNMTARIEGFAGPGERQAQALSEARSRAVEAFYVEEGIGATRLDVVGRGAPSGNTSKKEGAEQYRRVDTLPRR